MLVVDLVAKKMYENDELLALFDASAPYAKLVEDTLLPTLPISAPAPRGALCGAARFRLHARRREDDPAADGARRQGRRVVDGRRHAAGLSGSVAASGVCLLSAAVCPGDEPGHRPAARGLRGLAAYAVGALVAHAGQERPAGWVVAGVAVPVAGAGRLVAGVKSRTRGGASSEGAGVRLSGQRNADRRAGRSGRAGD